MECCDKVLYVNGKGGAVDMYCSEQKTYNVVRKCCGKGKIECGDEVKE
jgi:hypothetical protein